MNPNDRAIVVGIGRYPGYSIPPRPLAELKGPENDANAVHVWLTDPQGGGLSPGNARLILSSVKSPDPFPDQASWGPQEWVVRQALADLNNLPRTFEGQYTGRRLYVYVSGHGFSRARKQGALLTADGDPGRCLHVFVSDWVDCLYNAARFKEYVLWMDCCMTRDLLTTPQLCDLRLAFSPDLDQGLAFSAFSARFPKRAVENKMPNGEWHGAFTYALLSYLRRATASAGEVTTRGLRDYLFSGMKSFMHRDDLADPEVSKEPDFGYDDQFVLVPAGQQPTASPEPLFTLRFPGAALGRKASITKDLRTEVAAIVLDQAEWQVALHPGLYSVSVEGLSGAAPFQVMGGGADDVFTLA